MINNSFFSLFDDGLLSYPLTISRCIGRSLGNIYKGENCRMSMADAQTTTLIRANTTSRSLRTTVPAFIIRQFDLEEKDNLRWNLEAEKNKIIITAQPKRGENNGSK